MSDEAARHAGSQDDRLRRLENLDELLPTLAGVLDIREVFERVSAIAKTPGVYSHADVLVARRIADHVALALSHQRLAEEAPRAAQARALAQALEARVQSLAAQPGALTRYPRGGVG